MAPPSISYDSRAGLKAASGRREPPIGAIHHPGADFRVDASQTSAPFSLSEKALHPARSMSHCERLSTHRMTTKDRALRTGRLHGESRAENDLLHVAVIPSGRESSVLHSKLGCLFVLQQAQCGPPQCAEVLIAVNGTRCEHHWHGQQRSREMTSGMRISEPLPSGRPHRSLRGRTRFKGSNSGAIVRLGKGTVRGSVFKQLMVAFYAPVADTGF